MLYSEKDIKEFSTQTWKLLEKRLIRPSKGSYFIPTFTVMNEAESRRGNVRIIINYQKLNHFIKTNNYFLSNKEVLSNLVKSKIFLKI